MQTRPPELSVVCSLYFLLGCGGAAIPAEIEAPKADVSQLAHPSTAETALRSALDEHGVTLDQVSVKAGIDVMLEFFERVTFGPLADGESDMLLFQWGVHEWPDGQSFEIDITRQLIWPAAGPDDDEEEMWQLSWTFRFEPTKRLRALGSGDRWCTSRSRLATFRNYIAKTAAFRATAGRADAHSELQFVRAE